MSRIFLVLIFVLLLFGIFILASASSNYSYIRFGSIYYLTFKQLTSIFIGLFGFIIGTKIDPNIFKKYRILVYFFVIILLLLVFVPSIGFTHASAKRWLSFGFLFFQPFEFVKILFVFLVTSFILSKKMKITDFKKGILKITALVLPIFLLLAIEPELDGLVLLFSSFLLILYLSRAKLTHILFLGFAAVFSFLIILNFYPARLQRINVFLHKSDDILNSEYHINQSLRALNYGGFFGVGYIRGLQKLGYLPESYSDSIFPVLVEELGFLGALFLIAIYLSIFFIGSLKLLQVQDNYLKISGLTLLFLFILQAYLNISSNMALIPFTGLTLPLISYGGSSIIAYLFGLGMVYNIIKK